jgi:hypothetical protein
MAKVTITAVPRKDFGGFGAIKAYFPNEHAGHARGVAR